MAVIAVKPESPKVKRDSVRQNESPGFHKYTNHIVIRCFLLTQLAKVLLA